jgi:hypothetical protein
VKTASTDKVFWIAAAAVMCLCAPTVLGEIGAMIAEVLGPGTEIPLLTATDRALAEAFTWGVVVSFLGVPFALLGLLVGTFVASRAGFRSSVGVALLVTMALAAGTVAHVARRSIESKSHYPFAVRR